MNQPPEKLGRETCAFCGFRLGKGPGERERTNEHVLASRLRSLIPQAEGGRVLHQRFEPLTGNETEWIAAGFDVKANRVCDVCNSGWMNDVDSRAIPFISPMIAGHGKHLHKHGQTCVASWAAKVALAFHLIGPEEAHAPIDHYREIEITKLPPRWTSVWLATYEDLPRVGFQKGYAMTTDDARCHTATILLGHMIAQVFGNVGHEEVTRESPRWDKALIQIWPYVGSVVWPPERIIGEGSLMPFIERQLYGFD